ncbi:molybdopterin-dependent oxidoreductase [Acidisoma cellulosilytica]|uniref:Molybdopterin-dependent oxidoreductase n=1 Tax=Acidisoma cellulosilyticum TaxID=2802395 RepID=A0A963Z1Z9_9PROT|nr:molybdopterin-dependent oxidoreductase [Acidisoma cellulosilyticum]MCB8881254.1 molybdopterin-dependent oxidoreductase [Acidisoma cellulosilyticum]
MSNIIAPVTRRSLLLGTVAASASAIVPAFADDAAPALGLPKGDPILTVSGKITRHNQGNTAVFDMASIEALGLESFTTLTPWTKRVEFQGVFLERFLQYLGASGTKLVCTALNDYACEIPLDMIAQDKPLMATKINGQYMPIDHFGPLFVIFDFDRHPEWQSNLIYNRCPWQLQTMQLV